MSDVPSRARAYLADHPGGIVPAGEVAAIGDGVPVGEVMQQLITVAAEHARAEISGYQVGAVGLGASGALILGANFEFAGAPLAQTVHGEQCLIANAIGAGETGLTRIAISAPPCGHCRQFLNELVNAETLEVIIPERPAARLSEFLPNSFGPRELGIEGGLMLSGGHHLSAVDEISELGQLAAVAARSSYAPYSQAPAGMAIEFADGARFSGGYLENAAFNPSLPPFQVTIARAIMAKRNASDVVMWACAELGKSAVDHFAFARTFFSRVSPDACGEIIELIKGDAP